MGVLIKKLSDTDFTMSEVHELIRAAYKERIEEGIHFQALHKTTEEIENRIKQHSGIVFLAIDEKSQVLLGTGTVLFHTNKKKQLYAGFILGAVKPEAQGRGIGTLLRHKREECAIEQGAIYISSSTAAKAKSAVNYQLNTGFKKYQFASASNTDYYSIYFRKYLTKTFKRSSLYCNTRYYLSMFITKLLFKQNGDFTSIGSICHKSIEYLKT